MNGSRRKLPWPARSVIAGTTGTAALSFAYAAERRLRPHHPGPLDYDDSLVPGQIVASVMHLPHVTAREENEPVSRCGGATAQRSACGTDCSGGGSASHGRAWPSGRP